MPRLENAPRPGLATWGIAVLLIGIALIVPVARAGAQGDVGELNSKIAEAKAQAQSLASKMQANTEALVAARSQTAAAAAKETELTTLLANGQQRSAELAAKLKQAKAQLRQARAQFARSQNSLSDRLVAIYTSSQPDSTAMLLNSDGFDDLATRAEMLNRIQDADSALVDRVRSLRQQVAGKVSSVDSAKQRSDAHNARIDAARQQISLVRSNAEAQANQFVAARAEQAGSIESLQANVGTWTKQVQKAEQAAQAADAEPVTQQQAADEVGGWLGDWAIPEAIVMCESGGNFNAVNPSSGAGGAYQILPSTWELYGGQGQPQDASPAEQSAIAAQIWADSGPGAWVCAG